MQLSNNDFERLKLPQIVLNMPNAQPTESAKRHSHLFLRGPIPLPWITIAANLPGKALHVGLLCWFLVGIRRARRVSLTPSKFIAFGLSRYSAYRGLAALEKAHLVAVERHRGRSPIVTLLDDLEESPLPQKIGDSCK
jgi:hypothetical protein